MLLILTMLGLVAIGMAVLYQRDSTYLGGPWTLTGTTELVTATTNYVTVEYPTAKVVIRALVNVQAGTGQTSITVRIRQDSSVSGALVAYALQNTVVAGNWYTLAITAMDWPVQAGYVSYCLTLQQAGGAGDGTINWATIDTEVLSG